MKFRAVMSIVLAVFLVVSLTMMAFRKLSPVVFWVIVIIAGGYAYLILPRLQHEAPAQIKKKSK